MKFDLLKIIYNIDNELKSRSNELEIDNNKFTKKKKKYFL